MKPRKWDACAVTSVSEESGQEGFLEEGRFQLVLRGQEKRKNRQRPGGGKNMSKDGGKEAQPEGRWDQLYFRPLLSGLSETSWSSIF